MRHHSTKDHKILMSSNPDMNWIRTEILLKSGRIYGAKEKYSRKIDEINPHISTHIARTDQNTHLPEGYIDSIKVGKPDFWIRRYLEGSFNFSEGSVFPNFQQNIVDISPDEIKSNVKKKGWKVLGGADFGIVDPTILVLIAIDPVDGVAYLYDEYGKTNLPVPHHAREMKRMLEHVPLGGLQGLYADPSGGRRNINDRRSVFDHYSEYGIFFEKGDNRIDPGIMKVYSYLEMGKFKVLRSMVGSIEEMTNYHYKPVELDGVPDNKPVDKDNHYVDSLRYIISTLPDDPDRLKTVSYGYDDFRKTSDDSHLPFELQDDPMDSYLGRDSYLNY